MNKSLSRPIEGPLANERSKVLLHDPLVLLVAKEILLATEKFLSTLDISLSSAVTISSIYRSITLPPKPDLGDLTVPCFLISKLSKQSPAQCAEKLCALLNKSVVGVFKNTGPYINVRLADEHLHRYILDATLSGEIFKRTFIESPPTTMVEFSQPNTHKELHVGHMRNIALGDALVHCVKYLGIPVITSTFPGDVGTHVAKCLWYLKWRNKEAPPERHKGSWLGAMYSKASNQLEAEENTPQALENNQTLSTILKQLEEKNGEYYELWETTRAWSIELLDTAYAWAGISFDKCYWESDCDSPSVALIKKLHREGRLIESDGALGFDLSTKKLGFCMLLKSDGNGLYATKDFVLALNKFADFKLDKSIYVVDLRQTFHLQQVFAALEEYGFPHAKDCYHLAYNYVELPSGPMSSRKGNIIPLERLITEMEATIKERYLNRYLETWPESEIDATATQIGQAAIKFGMNQMEPGTKIVFDIAQWLRLDGDSGPYVQYTCARIRSIMRKMGTIPDEYDAVLLQSPQERCILNMLRQFNEVIVKVAETLKTNLLCDYLIDLARLFNSYYAQEKVVSDNRPLTLARVALCRATDITLSKGLSLLGIKTPERM